MEKATIIYSTRTGNTEIMAVAIQVGLKQAGVQVTSKKTEKAKSSDVQNTDAIIFGCPTYYTDLLPSMKSFLFDIRKVNLKGKVGAAFGPYAWSGEAVQMITDIMKHIFQMNVIEPGLRLRQRPEGNDIEACVEFGRKIAAKIKEVKNGIESRVNIS